LYLLDDGFFVRLRDAGFKDYYHFRSGVGRRYPQKNPRWFVATCGDLFWSRLEPRAPGFRPKVKEKEIPPRERGSSMELRTAQIHGAQGRGKGVGSQGWGK